MSMLLLPLVMDRADLSSSLIGWNTAAGGLPTLLLTPLMPRLLRLLGFLRLLGLCLGLCAASLIVFNGVAAVWGWFLARFALGAGLAGIFAATEIWINLMAAERSRGRVVGLYGTGLAAGFGIGTGLVALTGSEGVLPFLATCAAFVLAGLVLVPARGIAPVIGPAPRIRAAYLLNRAPVPLLAALVFGAIEMGILSLIAVYGLRVGLNEPRAALMATAVAAGSLLCQFPLGMIADKVNRLGLLAGCAATGALCAFAIPQILLNLPALYAVLFIMGGAAAGLYTIGLTTLGETFERSDLPAANTAYLLMYGMGSLAGPPLAGAAMDWWVPNGLMLILGLLCGFYLPAPLVALLRRRNRVPDPG